MIVLRFRKEIDDIKNEVELLDKPQTEKELRISPELRQVRLDVVGMDRDRRLYCTEM